MKQSAYYLSLLGCISMTLFSCHRVLQQNQAHRGPIILGDSNTIVTETNPAYLKDNVTELEPQDNSVSLSETQPKKEAETVRHIPPAASVSAVESNNGKRFRLDLGHGVEIIFNGITTRTFQQQNPKKDVGLSYAVASGDLIKSRMTVKGLKDLEIKQRYLSYLYLKAAGKKLSLQNIGGYLSDWQQVPLAGNSGKQLISLKDLNTIRFKTVSRKTIRNGVLRAVRSARMSRQEKNFWLKQIKHTRSEKDKPCYYVLDDVQWQISGTTEDGQHLFKVLRIDL